MAQGLNEKQKKVFPIFVINREKEKNIWQKIVLAQSCYRICPFSGRLPFTRKAHLIEIFPPRRTQAAGPSKRPQHRCL